jgi:amidophosphoribosyltransferase
LLKLIDAGTITSMCGIAGVVTKHDSASVELYEALHMLQHRGQDSAGMVTYDGRFFHERKNNGLVREVFKQQDIEALKGSVGIGHVRYPTAGSLGIENAQPFYVNAPFGLQLIHNGNLTNTDVLRHQIKNGVHRHLRSDSDSEVLLNVLAHEIENSIKKNKKRSKEEHVFEGIRMLMKKAEGAYSCIVLVAGVGLVAFRDPYGVRPLVLGKRDKGEYMFASESAAFGPLGFELVRDIAPGEAVLITSKGTVRKKQCVPGTLRPCIFEYIYLARPDSMIDGISVYKTQLRFGRLLARQIEAAKLPIDTVMPIPDSSRPAALEIAHSLGVPYREGLVRNRYIGRTFIMPEQHTREHAVRRKLNTIPLEFEDKNILLVDDSIVRGTTIKRIIKMCREAGARKVYLASAAPPVRYPNVYGVDMPTRQELIAHNKTIKQVRDAIGADALFYQNVEDMHSAVRAGNRTIKSFEDSCFTGVYTVGTITKAYLKQLENSRLKKRV